MKSRTLFFCLIALSIIAVGSSALISSGVIPNKHVSIQDVFITEAGPLKVVAKQCDRNFGNGSVFTDGIAIVANENSQIGPISGTVFYDHDRNGEISKPDGILLKVENGILTPTSEVVFWQGLLHSAPGIGPPMLDCTAETVQGDLKGITHIKADLSAIFDTTQ